MSEPFLLGVDEDEAGEAPYVGTAPYGREEEEEEDDEEREVSCRETEEAEEERESEAGRSVSSEQAVLTEVQDEDDGPRSADDIILPTIPLRDETEEGRLAAAERRRTGR